MSRLFGKNGIKGIAVTEFTCEFAMQAGRAIAAVLSEKEGKTKFLIAEDTRSSSDTIAAALCAGLCSAGADAEFLGEIPAAALAWNVRNKKASGGIMITASHVNNDFNGIKLFSSKGFRLDDETEAEIESLLTERLVEIAPSQRKKYGKITHDDTAGEEYLKYIHDITTIIDLKGLKVAIDCGNGCTSSMAEKLFSGYGAEVLMMGNTPDGTNINTSGSMHMETLMEFVIENKCDCGLAFDGSGERCLAVDENGNLVDGDVIIALCTRDMQRREVLNNNTLITTLANNFGLVQFAKSKEIQVVTAPAGERSIIHKMIEYGCSVGGDPTGHIIFPDDLPSADSQLTGIKLLWILKKSGGPLSSLTGIIKKLPQVMLNVPIETSFREVWKNDNVITDLIENSENILGDEGRIIVREAGKDPVIRIRIEGVDFSVINTMALEIADTIKERTQCAQS